jgi:DNA end-binding protein Ku
VRGYEFGKPQYIRVTDDELEALEAEANSNIELKEFIPTKKVEPVYFESTYYLAPEKAAGKRIVYSPMRWQKVCTWLYHGTRTGISNQIAKGENPRLMSEEIELGRGLIKKLSSENFEPNAYEDERRNRVMAMIEDKVKGREITAAPQSAAPHVVIDLMAALKERMRTAQRGKKRAEERKRKKA